MDTLAEFFSKENFFCRECIVNQIMSLKVLTSVFSQNSNTSIVSDLLIYVMIKDNNPSMAIIIGAQRNIRRSLWFEKYSIDILILTRLHFKRKFHWHFKTVIWLLWKIVVLFWKKYVCFTTGYYFNDIKIYVFENLVLDYTNKLQRSDF